MEYFKEFMDNMDKKLTTSQEYDEAKSIVETLIAEATEKGMLEPEMDNEYTRQIAELSKQMAQYKDKYMCTMVPDPTMCSEDEGY